MKTKYSSLLLALLLPISYVNAEVSLTPPNAKAGECYAKVVVPAKYKTVEDRVLVQEASNKISITPAKYEWVDEKVEISPASKKLLTIPATFKKVTEMVEVRPSSQSWKVSLKRNAAPVSKEILVAAKLKGVDLDNTVPKTCYKEYFVPETYKTVSQEVILQKESQKTKIIPATYEMVEKTIILTPASKKTLTVPATYDYTEEKILIEKEKTVWKKGANPAQKLDGATGEIMCLVKVPAKYKTIRKKVVKTAATTKVIEVPAVSKTIKVKKLINPAKTETINIPAVNSKVQTSVLDTKATFSWIQVGNTVDKGLQHTGHRICLVETPAKSQKITKIVLDTAASIKEVAIEPRYKTMKVKKLIQEAQEVKTPIEAVYKIVNKKEKVSASHQSWKRILCQTNMNQNVVLKIQNALEGKNYNPGKIDGVLGKDTRVALDKYQRDNSLATGGITYETLNALNVGL
ncbi:MAG: Reverse transcriptase [uncultured Sulfurovum sp.]|uniref:Reverse transcriptase n=1 Tax=uncultured Sulfurovum sp. TaxID=269237 RepID=A0A6S6UFN0_9BACT|nr:MAG: Reverse transcriptase [uncultured Sulfurovum sp.]